MNRKLYPTDLADAEWQIIAPLVERKTKVGAPTELDIREVVNAIFYLVDNGIKWRAMPHDLLQEDPVLYATLRQLITCTNAQERVTFILDGRPTMLLCAFALAACQVLTRSETVWRTVFALRESVSPASFVPQTS